MRDRFSRAVFLVAGIYGLLALVPGYFSEKTVGEIMPPAITHPEFYYGFLGVGVAWQIAFLIIAHDPARFRPLIAAAMVEKLSYGLACLALFALRRIPLLAAAGGAVDFLLCAFFVAAYVRLKPPVHPDNFGSSR